MTATNLTKLRKEIEKKIEICKHYYGECNAGQQLKGIKQTVEAVDELVDYLMKNDFYKKEDYKEWQKIKELLDIK